MKSGVTKQIDPNVSSEELSYEVLMALKYGTQQDKEMIIRDCLKDRAEIFISRHLNPSESALTLGHYSPATPQLPKQEDDLYYSPIRKEP